MAYPGSRQLIDTARSIQDTNSLIKESKDATFVENALRSRKERELIADVNQARTELALEIETVRFDEQLGVAKTATEMFGNLYEAQQTVNHHSLVFEIQLAADDEFVSGMIATFTQKAREVQKIQSVPGSDNRKKLMIRNIAERYNKILSDGFELLIKNPS